MGKHLGGALLTAALLAAGSGWPVFAHAEARQPAMFRRQIQINGTALYHPYSFVYRGTTYMPIWYVMQALKSLGVKTQWNGASRAWRLQANDIPAPTPIPVSDNGETGIYINGLRAVNAPARVARDPQSGTATTFMPIWYVMRALRELGIESTWKNGVWNLSAAPGGSGPSGPGGPSSGQGAGPAGSTAATGPTPPDSGASGTSGASSSPGGSASAAAGGSSSGAPSSASSSSGAAPGIPAGVPAPGSVAAPTVASGPSGYLLDGVTAALAPTQNSALPDARYWNRASESFYVSAQTNNPEVVNSPNTPLLSAEPGQTLYLFAFSDQQNIVGSSTTWHVNSPDATVTPSSSVWTQGQNQIAKADFTATKPGVYTVQAEYDGKYSVPLVIVIGMSQLSSQPISAPAVYSGVLPLPSSLPSGTRAENGGVTYVKYPAIGGWIPVSGTAPVGLSSITVVLTAPGESNISFWDYRLPVQNGTFGALLRSPFSGNVQVTLFPNYLQTLTISAQTNGSFNYPDSNYSVNVNGPMLTTARLSLLASSQGDFNLSPKFSQTASTLLENSPSLETGMEAISNYVSDVLVYNTAEATFNSNGAAPNYVYQNNLSAWSSGSGICQDYATLLASLFQSVGIPAQVLGGYANSTWKTAPASDSNPADAHAWVRAWNGSSWIVMDPTWNNEDQSVNSYITDQFFTNTQSLQETHLLVPSQTGTVMSAGSPPANPRRVRA